MVERTLLLEMFKHKTIVKEEAAIEVRNKFGIAQFTKTYIRSEIEIIFQVTQSNSEFLCNKTG